MNRKIFVSYAHKDTKRVHPIVQKLTSLGFDVWFDKNNIQGGDLWSTEISRAIRDCECYVLFVSKASMGSDPIRREVDLAYTHKRKMILVRLDATQIPIEMAYQTTGIQWIDTREIDWLSRLLVALGSDDQSTPRTPDSSEQSQVPPDDPIKASVHIGGNAKNSTIIIGNNNTVKHGKSR